MMKERRKRITSLKLEIEEIEKLIEKFKENGKIAFASRLSIIIEKKTNLLDSWISTFYISRIFEKNQRIFKKCKQYFFRSLNPILRSLNPIFRSLTLT